jgi:HlyD family secretion protein
MSPSSHPAESARFPYQQQDAPAQGEAPRGTDPPAQTQSPQSQSPKGWKLRPSRRWLYGLAGLGSVCLIALVFRPAPTRVDLVTITPTDLQVTVDAEGKTRVQDRFVVAAPVDGRLARIDLSVGDGVEADTIVARIDPLPFTSQVSQAQARIESLRAEIAGVETQRPKDFALQQARDRIQAAQAEQRQTQADLTQARAELAQAQRDRQRADDLAARGAIPTQDRESALLAVTSQQQAVRAAEERLQGATSAVRAAQQDLAILQAEQQDPDYLLEVYQAEINQVEAELARLADEAQRTDITAPVSGLVLRLPEESARYVTAGTPLLELGNPNSLELVIDVLSSDAVKIQPGDPIQVNQWGGDDTLMARVRYIEPSAFTKVSALGVEEQRVNIIADFESANLPLGDGFRVDTQIVIGTAEDALTVPISALFPCDPGTCVFSVAAGRAYLTPVTPGARNTFESVIESGLTPGDTVIVFPESVEAGHRIEPR